MVSKVHCPVCGFLMMMEVQGSDVTYTCINSQHESTGEPEGIHMSQNMLDAYKSLGNNVDVLLEYLKRP